MALPPGMSDAAMEAATFDPATPLSLAWGRVADPAPQTRPPSLDEVPALLLALLGRTEPALSPVEQSALRACLRLAGESLPLQGALDADFYEALLAFKARHGLAPVDPRLDLATLTAVVRQAALAVGGPTGGWTAAFRGVWFDTTHAPALVAEAPGIVNLIRELKGGRTRQPMMAPIPLDDE